MNGFEIYLEVDSTGLAKGLIPGEALRQRGSARITPSCFEQQSDYWSCALP